MRWLRRNWFLVGLVAAVGLAWLFPAAGARGGLLHSEITIRAGVVVIYFLQGLTLALDALRHGALRWRLHVLVQAWTFLLFPLAGLLLDRVAGARLPPDLRTGFLFLCVLPTTISTAIVFTSVAGGNVAGAIFNATLSNLLGIALTPLWTGWLMRAGGRTLPLGPVILEIVLLLLVPLAAGQALRPWLRRWADARKPRLAGVNSGIVLFIVYAAFANSVEARVWERYGAHLMLLALAGVVLLFAFVMGGGLGDHPRRPAGQYRRQRGAVLRVPKDPGRGRADGAAHLRRASRTRPHPAAGDALPSAAAHGARHDGDALAAAALAGPLALPRSDPESGTKAMSTNS
jgi:sodium/bile acid cotransporter 7